MKRFLCLFLCSCAALQAEAPAEDTTPLVEGVYLLEGSNPGSNEVNYRGAAEIRPEGTTYALSWRIGFSQTQVEWGIWKNRVLSVAYYDLASNQTGVVSFYLVAPGKLEGTWAGYGSDVVGKESLTLQ